MNVIHGPARVILLVPTAPNASDLDIDKAIEFVPSLQPGLLLHGHNPKTGQWPVVGTIVHYSTCVARGEGDMPGSNY